MRCAPSPRAIYRFARHESYWYVHALSRTGLPRQVRESKHEATKAVIAKRLADRQKTAPGVKPIVLRATSADLF
jgi:hypothetical protein